MSKVSVIIPVYNVEEYLEKCLDSVCNQTLKEIEIICVNDCSPDNSLEILDVYSKKDSRIKILNRSKNGGLSAARNTGLKLATSEYVYFLDSDDWIDLDYIEKMYIAAIENNANIVANVSGYEVRPDSKRYMNISDVYNPLEVNAFSDYGSAVYKTFIGAPFKIFKKSFLDDYSLKFPVDYIFEDLFFQYISYYYAKEVFVIDGSYYYYNIRDNSIMTNTSNRDNFDLNHLKIFNLIFEYLENKSALKNANLKLFNDKIFFQDLTEEKYLLYKNYFEKISCYVEIKKSLYKDIELMFMGFVLNTKTYEDYKTKYNADFKVIFLREKIKKGIR